MTCHCSSPAEHASRAVSSATESSNYDRARAIKERDDALAKVGRLTAAQRAAANSTTNYQIERVEQFGKHLVMQVRYPNCEHRAYEGLKTMVFLNVSALDALKWKSIDPHFRGPNQTQQAIAKRHALPIGTWDREQTEAPSPAARFPGDASGWADATVYAKGKAT